MKLKRRLRISNILMVIVPAVIILIIAGVINVSFSKVYENKFENDRTHNPNPYFIQQYLRPDVGKILNKYEIEELGKKFQKFLEPKGYDLIVTYDDEVILSNLTEGDKSFISNMEGDVLFQSNSLVLEMNSTSVVKNSFKENEKVVNILAINSEYKPKMFDVKKEMETFVISYVVIVFIISLIVVTVTNTILSSKIYKKLIVPLELLSYGAEQIKNGNLDFQMNYDSDDEFGQVCNDFDEMRIRLKSSVDMQLKYEENRKQLIVGISHDLRTPLTAIKGYVEGLRDGIAKTPEKQKKYLNTVYVKACDMDTLVDSLFLFSKLDTGCFPFKFNLININEYMNKFYEYADKEFYSKNVEILFKSKCEESIIVKLDPQEIKRVLLNILDNSVKYNKDKNVKINISLYERENVVVLEINDNGVGVQDKDIPNLFTSFYRGDAARTRPNEGSGLGLAISKNIIEAHNGEISAYNMNGLTIEIILPKNSSENNSL